jgi:DNA (cytosine-5)-methyltransferase 1
MIVLKNVCGLLTSHGGHDFAAIADTLTDGGYRFGALVIDAAYFVPQSRERVFIVGVDAALPILTELLDNRLSSPFHP